MLVFTYWYRMNKSNKVIPKLLLSPPLCGSTPAHLEAAGFRDTSILLTLGKFPSLLEPVSSFIKWV